MIIPNMGIRVYSPSESSCEHFKGSDEHVEKQWGGARPGAGRRPADPEDKRVQMVITIDRDTRDKLKARAKEQHVRVGRLIDEWVNETFYI